MGYRVVHGALRFLKIDKTGHNTINIFCISFVYSYISYIFLLKKTDKVQDSNFERSIDKLERKLQS